MKKFLKKKFVFVLLGALIIAAMVVISTSAGGGVTRHTSPAMSFSSTGWGGWSCPAGTVVVGGGYLPSSHTVNVSEAAKPGSVSGLYPNYPHYNYTPPEEGWVVQNGGVAASLQIYVDCAPEPEPEVLPEYICHATGSPTNPFILNSPNTIGQLMGHVGPGHQNGEDIIPPVPGFLPGGQNWDTEGMAIWENGCEVPPAGELCGRCSTSFVGWVAWYDRDGGCDDDYNNERVEYPYDERCYTACEVTTEAISYTEWVAGVTTYTDWVDIGGGQFRRFVRTPYTRTRTEAQIGELEEDCGSEDFVEYRGQIAVETENGTTEVYSNRTCEKAWAHYEYFDPDHVFVGKDPNVRFFWAKPFELESVTLLGVEIFEPEKCLPEPKDCGRCSTKFVGWVEWVDRDGGCDDDYYNQRVEYPFDERCYGECSLENQTLTDDSTPWVNVGDPYGFGDWVSEEGRLCKYGSLDQERTFGWTITDKNTNKICSSFSEPQTRTVEAKHCDDDCSEGNVVSLGKVFADPSNVGTIVWGAWQNPLSGSPFRYGIQGTSSAWTETFVDARDGEVICRIDEGAEEGEKRVYEEKCAPRWTGRFAQTYVRSVAGHYLTFCTQKVPEVAADINGDGKLSFAEAKKWRWDPAYLAGACALDCESQDWQGNFAATFREFSDVCGDDHLFGGCHYDESAGTPGDVCDWLNPSGVVEE